MGARGPLRFGCFTLLGFFLAAVTGCAGSSTSFTTPYGTTYHALSPKSVETSGVTDGNLQDVFESELGRYSLTEFDAEGNLTTPFVDPQAKVTNALIVSDFLKYRTFPVEIKVLKGTSSNLAGSAAGGTRRKTKQGDTVAWALDTGESEDNPEYKNAHASKIFSGAVSVYIGIGVRIIADVNNISGKVDLTNLPAVAASVSANSTHGTIAVGTMGISGNNLGLLIQQPVALNDTTVQSALQTVGAIKAGLASAGAPAAVPPAPAAKPTYQLRPVILGYEGGPTDPVASAAVEDFISKKQFKLTITPGAAAGLYDGVKVEEVADSGGSPIFIGMPSTMAYSNLIHTAQAASIQEQQRVADFVKQSFPNAPRTEGSPTEQLQTLDDWIKRQPSTVLSTQPARP